MFRQSNQFGHGMHSHLLHHVGTMDFDRLLGGAELAGNLFVQFASNDIFEHFPLTRCKRGQARADFGKFGLLLPKGAVFLNRHTNGCKQVCIVHGLGEEINRAAFQRLDTFWNVAMAGEKNNGRRRAFFSEGSLESKTIASHLNIKHQAARRIWIIVFKKFFRRGEGGDGEPMRAQQTRERVANGRVVVYKKYGGAWGNSHQWLITIFLRLTTCKEY